jgi:hypothetical protein
VNIPIRSSDFVLILTLGLTIACCERESETPTAPTSVKIEVDTTIISYSAMGKIGGPGYYYKTTRWNERSYPLSGDSVLKMLLDSNFTVLEFWYPQTASICLDPSTHEREITKLEKSDTTIYRLAYAPLDSGYTDPCIRTWRYYKIRRVQGGA